MNDESVSFIARNTFSKLLQRPLGCRVACDIEVKESSRTDFHDEEDVDQLKCRGDNNKEITGDDGFSVITHKGHPPLLRACRTPGCCRHISPNGAWRNPDA